MIPKQHVADIFEYNDVLASDVFARIPKVARALEKAFPEMEGLNILNNNKEVAYQSVFHSHVHLIPVIQKKMISLFILATIKRTIPPKRCKKLLRPLQSSELNEKIY